jgi:hypothetical protein
LFGCINTRTSLFFILKQTQKWVLLTNEFLFFTVYFIDGLTFWIFRWTVNLIDRYDYFRVYIFYIKALHLQYYYKHFFQIEQVFICLHVCTNIQIFLCNNSSFYGLLQTLMFWDQYSIRVVKTIISQISDGNMEHCDSHVCPDIPQCLDLPRVAKCSGESQGMVL